MSRIPKPTVRPADPRFSSGPCKKRPGWRADLLRIDSLGRSHRGSIGRARLREAVAKTRAVLGVPDAYRIAITPASDTGAVELALWLLLGARPVDLFAWDSFGLDWARDASEELRLDDLRVMTAPYGRLPDLSVARGDADIVFTWNGTTSGVRVPNADWIAPDRTGLTICDATSAAFAQVLDWPKLDVVTLSFQKALGGEGQHGVLIMSPRAYQRLSEYDPPRPLPKLFRLKQNGVVNDAVFDGSPLNTTSNLVIEDWIDALDWAASIGGLPALIARADANASVLTEWIDTSTWARNLAEDPATRTNTSVCLTFTDAGPDHDAARAASMAKLLEAEGAAFDVGGYRSAPPGLRVWCGATVEASDVAALLAWLDWAYDATSPGV